MNNSYSLCVTQRTLYDHHAGMGTSLSGKLVREVDEVVSIARDDATIVDGRLCELLLVCPFLASILVDADDVKSESSANHRYVGGKIFVNNELHRR